MCNRQEVDNYFIYRPPTPPYVRLSNDYIWYNRNTIYGIGGTNYMAYLKENGIAATLITKEKNDEPKYSYPGLVSLKRI